MNVIDYGQDSAVEGVTWTSTDFHLKPGDRVLVTDQPRDPKPGVRNFLRRLLRRPSGWWDHNGIYTVAVSLDHLGMVSCTVDHGGAPCPGYPD